MVIVKINKCIVILLFLFQTIFCCAVQAHFETAKLFAADGNNGDGFGISVAVDGNFAVVGAYQNDSNGIDCGAAYVYELSGSQWLQRQKLTSSDGSAGGKFGRSVAIQNNIIVIGSYYDDSNGSVYVFTQTDAGWTQQQKLTAPDAVPKDRFGCRAAIDNNTIVVGAYRGNNYTGCAYVFTRAASNWDFQAELTSSDAHTGDYFGYSVAIDNNTILIGAPNWAAAIGSAYFYQRQGSAWLQKTVLRGDTGHFGVSVAIDGNEAVIGAYESDVATMTGAGAAYVYNKIDANWVQGQQLFDANDPCGGDDFGWAVAIKNGKIAVGCPYDFVNGDESGSVFEFVREDATWVQSCRLTAGDADANDEFGRSVALSGRHIVAGAPRNINDGNSTGSAYVFDDFSADLDGDSDVDFFDFAVLAGFWRQNNPLADIAPEPDGDGIVDFKDLAVLCENWLTGK